MNADPAKTALVVLFYCLLLCLACCNSKKEYDTATTSCDTTLQTQYTNLLTATSDAKILSGSIQEFYLNTPADCRNQIVYKLAKDLFNLSFTTSLPDTSVSSFYLSIIKDPALTLTNKTKVLLVLANYHMYINGNPEEALLYMNRANSVVKTMDDTLKKSYNALMAEYMMRNSRIQEAASYYLNTLRLSEKIKDSLSIALSYGNFALIHSKTGQYAKSIAMQKQAISYFERKGDQQRLILGYQGVGVNYGLLREYDSALVYYKKVAELIKNGARNANAEFDNYNNLAAIYSGKNKYDSARFYYDRAKKIRPYIDWEQKERTFIMASTPAYSTVRNVNGAIEKIKSYIPVFLEQNDISSAKDAYQVLFHTYYLQDNYRMAFNYYKTWDSISKTLTAQENKNYISELETRYETRKKELEIKVQKKEIRQKNMLNVFLIVLLVFGGLGTAFIITNIKLKRNRKDAELQRRFTGELIRNTESERSRIARDLHDSVSQELLVLKQQIINNPGDSARKVDAIIHEIRMISRDLHPVMLDKIGFKASVEHICQQMMEAHLLFITAEISYKDYLDKNQELQLFRIIQEALNNTVKYAEAEAAKVTITADHKFWTVEVRDNGKGFDVANTINAMKTFGLLSIKERSKMLQGKAHFSSSSEGTIVKIEVPKKNV